MVNRACGSGGKHRLYPGPQLTGTERLCDVLVGPAAERFLDIRFVGAAREHHGPGGAEGPDAPQDFETVDVRKADVDSHNAGKPAPHQVHPLESAGSGVDGKSRLFQDCAQKIAHIGVVLYDDCHSQSGHGQTPRLAGA
jgi:hypothetical protein